ncbi:DNA polymerase III subunit delta' [Sphingobium sufflavum]|uniref:DNA polymerase III subunit delta' n=1 Tax=Sphingobium sufflavum TaxID=1129547 RepID=UPI001F47C328|nr:DNA polymerase III subunit delta' [Sphingobium sufflavum]MCE7797997.1 DNA polymerase III subunit delta' [Sphingobium sufflavum]
MGGWRGQDRAIAELMAALGGERLHHAWLLGGQAGIGKAGVAFDFAKRLLGAQSDTGVLVGNLVIAPDDPVARLVDAGTHPDLVQIRRLPRDTKKGEAPTLARNITVDQVRSLSRFLHLAPSMAARRVILIDAAEDMERGAANALLKNLEEPPRNTIFLLISHMPGRLLPTIRSRCRTLHFQPLDDAAMEDVLTGILPDLPPAERQALIRGAEGAPGRALAMRDLDLAGLEAALERIAQGGDPTHRERIQLARALSPKAAQARYEAFLDYVPHYIARRLRAARSGADGQKADAWLEAVQLGQGAITLSLDPSATIFALCGTVARLAERKS